jgi:hypothetical protein
MEQILVFSRGFENRAFAPSGMDGNDSPKCRVLNERLPLEEVTKLAEEDPEHDHNECNANNAQYQMDSFHTVLNFGSADNSGRRLNPRESG